MYEDYDNVYGAGRAGGRRRVRYNNIMWVRRRRVSARDISSSHTFFYSFFIYFFFFFCADLVLIGPCTRNPFR